LATSWTIRDSNPSRDKIFFLLWELLSLLSRVKWPESEVNHSSPSSAEVKNEWNYTSTPRVPSWCGTPWLSLLRHYKSEGRGFDSQLCHWNFSLIQSFWPYYDPGVNSASIRNEYQKYILGGKGGRWVGLTDLPPSCASCLDIWEPQPPGALKACTGIALLYQLWAQCYKTSSQNLYRKSVFV